jgi:hypothetical protein
MPSTSQRDPQITKGMTKAEKMQSNAPLKPKAHRSYVRCCRHHRPPSRTPDHHYYQPLTLQEHRRQKQELPWVQHRPSPPLAPRRRCQSRR